MERLLLAPRHQQLKNFISTAEPDIIYYACEHEIYALHLSTRKREAIASLPWKVQCLDARHGWICVGGPDKGRCAFICINGQESGRSQGTLPRHEAEVDALLPLDLDPESRSLTQSYFGRLRSSSPPSRSKPEVQIHELAGSIANAIMNSVAIYRMRVNQKNDEIVCVMTYVYQWDQLLKLWTDPIRNNDSTVRIFSLSRSRLLNTLQFSTRMNHASISPDGQLLVAVGDQPKAFFCRRVLASTSSGDQDASHIWQEIAEPRLNPACIDDGCFTTAFSPSGHICAVAQQSGVVTIFDTSMIHEDMGDDDAVLEVLKSSRSSIPYDFIGAIRSMSFSPAPWDLLAWAEERGRVCVADLRSAYCSRQTVDLDLDSPKLNRASVTDLEDGQTTAEKTQLEIERRFLQRHREALNAQNDLANVGHVADYIELSAARRRLQRDTAEIPGEFSGLTESERQMLDSIRTSRAQEDDLSNIDQDFPRTISIDRPSDQISGPPEPRFNPQLPTLSSSSASASAPLARADSMRDTIRRNHLDRSRTADRGIYQPRRRSSVVISNSNHPSNQPSSSHPSSLAPIATSAPTLSASPSRLASIVASAEHVESSAPSAYSSSEAWRTVADAMVNAPLEGGLSDIEADHPRGTGGEDRNRDSASASTVFRLLQQQQLQQQQAARLDRLRSNQAQRSRQQVQAINRAMAGERGYEDTELDMLRRPTDPSTRMEYGVRTMGIGWEGQGRSL
ncbi:MAG: hypothetical protein Q9209_004342 [Squamulea sp. 1 TL-2023]